MSPYTQHSLGQPGRLAQILPGYHHSPCPLPTPPFFCYPKDTEEYINIELDASRNKLIRLDIILTAAAFSIAPFNLLAGILGENLVIPPQLTRDVLRFYVLNGVAALLCCSFFYAILRYMRYRRLI